MITHSSPNTTASTRIYFAIGQPLTDEVYNPTNPNADLEQIPALPTTNSINTFVNEYNFELVEKHPGDVSWNTLRGITMLSKELEDRSKLCQHTLPRNLILQGHYFGVIGNQPCEKTEKERQALWIERVSANIALRLIEKHGDTGSVAFFKKKGSKTEAMRVAPEVSKNMTFAEFKEAILPFCSKKSLLTVLLPGFAAEFCEASFFEKIIAFCTEKNIRLHCNLGFSELVKRQRELFKKHLKSFDKVYCNIHEARALVGDDHSQYAPAQLLELIGPLAPNTKVFITCGSEGVWCRYLNKSTGYYESLGVAAVEARREITNTLGCGDNFQAIQEAAYKMLKGHSDRLRKSIETAVVAAREILFQHSGNISPESIERVVSHLLSYVETPS